jgi:hypothetical protein
MNGRRQAYAQSDPKSCGAVCIMSCVDELAGHGFAIGANVDEMKIHRQIWERRADVSLASKVAAYLQTHKLNLELIEDKDKTDLIRASSAPFDLVYRRYKIDVRGSAVVRFRRRGGNAFTATDFDNDARLMFMAILVGATGTHWLLARRDAGDFWVMNPDGGSDSRITNLLTWMNGAWTTMQSIGGVNYLFSGTVLRVIA